MRNPRFEKATWTHLRMLSQVVSIVSDFLGTKADDIVCDLDVNLTNWKTFLGVSFREAGHLGL